MGGPQGNQRLLGCTQFRPRDTGGAVPLTPARGDPGALLRLGMDVMNREVQNAMDESHILEKMAAEAGKKLPGMKPIKGITDQWEEEVSLESQTSTPCMQQELTEYT
uniref:BPI fold containing family B member 6 n=1 Tax=Balaenoptera musculus TaxID=9771 RepID=A0A8C0DMG5_BALMU